MRRFFEIPTWRNPFDELERVRRQMDSLFDAFGGTVFRPLRAQVFPLINLTENRDAYFVRAELPGIENNSLDIQATSKNVSISGERKIGEFEKAKYHRKERDSGTFNRIINLPGEINSDLVEAKLVDGVLTLKLPKQEARKPKQITIK